MILLLLLPMRPLTTENGWEGKMDNFFLYISFTELNAHLPCRLLFFMDFDFNAVVSTATNADIQIREDVEEGWMEYLITSPYSFFSFPAIHFTITWSRPCVCLYLVSVYSFVAAAITLGEEWTRWRCRVLREEITWNIRHFSYSLLDAGICHVHLSNSKDNKLCKKYAYKLSWIVTKQKKHAHNVWNTHTHTHAFPGVKVMYIYRQQWGLDRLTINYSLPFN